MPLQIYFSFNQQRFLLRGEEYNLYDQLEDQAIVVFNLSEIFIHTVGTFPVPSRKDILAAIGINGGLKFNLGAEEDMESDPSIRCKIRPLLNQQNEASGMALILFPYIQDPLHDPVGDVIKWPLRLVVEPPKADHPAFKKIGPTHHYFPL